TYSLCTLEFEAHRPLYDWFIQNVGAFPSRQIEFARLNLTYTVMSKRKLLELVQKKLVDGWDDPRMPTICGLRRRGYTPESIKAFAERIGVAKKDSMVDLALLEHTVREDLNARVPRYMAVIDPLKVVIENLPEGEVIEFDAPLSPEDPNLGTRKIALTREVFIEREDFMEVPSKKWFRLSPGAEVRLRYACLLKCHGVVKDESGRVLELRCTWDPESKGGVSPDNRKVKGTLHWVSAAQAIGAEVRLYDKLFTIENLGDMPEGASYIDYLNPESLVVVNGARLEPAMAALKPGDRVQFERVGYFCVDTKDSKPGALVFNRTVGLKDSWQKVAAKEEGEAPAAKAEPAKAEAAKAPAPTPTIPANLAVPEAHPNFKELAPEITIDEFLKVDLRVAIIRHAEAVPEADKLLRLLVDVGEGRLRQIFAGIKKAYDPATIIGKRIIIVANLKPRQMKFGLSEGMLLAAGEVPDLGLATFDRDVTPGDRIG
ncbi:MAG TPA: methionine--tRNA ligase subunit beta, partial [Myxococcota bacterium]|nr:methionine--tRNA ligase subunit beta [Myxococcota bacterium]